MSRSFVLRTPDAPSRRCRRALPTLFTLGLALTLATLPAPPSAADDAEALARTTEVTSAREQLDFGVRMARRGLWSEALFRFQQAQSLEPGNPQTLNNIAVSYEALGRFEQALTAYQEAIRADPSNRDLKKNYSRFVEFYRAFRPDDQKDASVPPSAAEQ